MRETLFVYCMIPSLKCVLEGLDFDRFGNQHYALKVFVPDESRVVVQRTLAPINHSREDQYSLCKNLINTAAQALSQLGLQQGYTAYLCFVRAKENERLDVLRVNDAKLIDSEGRRRYRNQVASLHFQVNLSSEYRLAPIFIFTGHDIQEIRDQALEALEKLVGEIDSWNI